MQENRRVQGAVSLWVGSSPSRDALQDYVDIDYSTTDLSRLSRFADDFGTGLYDHDFMETDVTEKSTRSLSELLQGCSYNSVVVPTFLRLIGEQLPVEANAFVLLYDFQHHGSLGTAPVASGPVELRYMGLITVGMPGPSERL